MDCRTYAPNGSTPPPACCAPIEIPLQWPAPQPVAVSGHSWRESPKLGHPKLDGIQSAPSSVQPVFRVAAHLVSTTALFQLVLCSAPSEPLQQFDWTHCAAIGVLQIAQAAGSWSLILPLFVSICFAVVGQLRLLQHLYYFSVALF